MDFRTRSFDPDSLVDAFKLLPDKAVPVVYALRLRDGALYIATSNHMQWRAYQIARGMAGATDSTATALVRRLGVRHLEAMKVCKTEAGANALAETWTTRARKLGEKIATDTLAEENRAADAAHLWAEDVAQITGDRVAAEDF
jgi:hypothetical protein